MKRQGFRYRCTGGGRTVESCVTVPGFLPPRVAYYSAALILALTFETIESFKPDPALAYRADSQSLMLLTRQLAVLVKVGIPVHRALEFLSESHDDDLRQALDEAAGLLASGHTLSGTVARLPGVFGANYHGFVRVAETSGQLEATLELLARELEESSRLRQRVGNAITYPLFLMLGSLLLSGVLIFGVVPMLTPTLIDLGVELPLLTRAVVWLAGFGSHPLVMVSAFLILLTSFLLLAFLYGPTGHYTAARRALDRFVLALPVVGELVHRYWAAQVLATLALSLTVGVPLVRAFHDAEGVVQNTALAKRVVAGRQELELGKTLLEALGENDVLPSTQVSILQCGAASGSLEDTVQMLSRQAAESVEAQLSALTVLLEPLALGFMSVVVTLVALATFLPWIRLVESIL